VLFHLFVVKFLLVSFFIFYTMVVVIMKEVKLVVVVDDLDFKILNVSFDANVFNRYGTFDRIINMSMEDPSYAYLHCECWTWQL
jgi:hypothetical protein